MFETSVVQARVKTASRRPLLFSLSIAAHAAVVVGVVVTSVASVSLPTRAPKQFSSLVIPVIPPMRGDDGGVKQTKTATEPVQAPKPAATRPAIVAPSVVPEHVAAVAPSTSTADLGPVGSTATGPTTGDASGPGVPWGSKDGIGDNAPPAPEAPAPIIYKPGGDVKAPVVIRRVTPPYPPLAQKMRMNGFVILSCIIDQSGHIRDARVVKSSFAAFEQPALDAVYQWQFAPGTMNGAPVDVQFDLKVTFEIR